MGGLIGGITSKLTAAFLWLDTIMGNIICLCGNTGIEKCGGAWKEMLSMTPREVAAISRGGIGSEWVVNGLHGT